MNIYYVYIHNSKLITINIHAFILSDLLTFCEKTIETTSLEIKET